MRENIGILLLTLAVVAGCVSTETSKLRNFETSKPRNLETSKPRNSETSKPRNFETSKPRNLETSKPRNLETSKPRNLETSKLQNSETSKPRNVETSKPRNLETSKPAATPAERLRVFLREVNDRRTRLGTAEAVAKIEDYRKTCPDCTNLEMRIQVDFAILDRCSRDRLSRGLPLDEKVATETVLRVAPRVYGESKIDDRRKTDAVRRHATTLCDEGRYEDAIALAKWFTGVKNSRGQENAFAYALLKDIYRLANRYPDAKAAMVKAIELMGGNADWVGIGCALALEFNDVKSVPEFWKLAKGPNAVDKKVVWVCANRRALEPVAKWRDEVIALGRPLVSDTTLKPDRRIAVACALGLTEDTPNGAALRAAVRDIVQSGKVRNLPRLVAQGEIKRSFMDGDWRRFVAVYGDLGTIRELNTPELRRAHVYALAALGRLAEAKTLSAKYRAELTKPIDLLRMDAMMAVLEDRDALPIIAAAKLEPKEHIGLIQRAGRWALVLEKNDAARRYAEAYAKLVKTIPQRRQNVTWSAKPMDGESSYRALWPQLEKSYIDVKMCGDLDNLVTDVATGRVAIEKTEKDTKDAKVEVTTCCDARGLHIYLRVIDPNARAVQDGFAGGKGSEMYFAPGDNEPYICFGGGPKKPIEYLFQTTYSWKGHRRLDWNTQTSPCNMGSETFFSDEDYVEHLFFPWDAFYQKLPVAGTEWKFECLMDGYSWGGSQGVHESSSWGRLVFNLKPEELTAIRRRILLDNVKSWKRGEAREYVSVAPFDRWADPVIGDPDFYKACLKSLEEELDGYAKRVKPEMTDADVNDIYEHAVPRWIGLKPEIDRLRREYLQKKATTSAVE